MISYEDWLARSGIRRDVNEAGQGQYMRVQGNQPLEDLGQPIGNSGLTKKEDESNDAFMQRVYQSAMDPAWGTEGRNFNDMFNAGSQNGLATVEKNGQTYVRVGSDMKDAMGNPTSAKVINAFGGTQSIIKDPQYGYLAPAPMMAQLGKETAYTNDKQMQAWQYVAIMAAAAVTAGAAAGYMGAGAGAAGGGVGATEAAAGGAIGGGAGAGAGTVAEGMAAQTALEAGLAGTPSYAAGAGGALGAGEATAAGGAIAGGGAAGAGAGGAGAAGGAAAAGGSAGILSTLAGVVGPAASILGAIQTLSGSGGGSGASGAAANAANLQTQVAMDSAALARERWEYYKTQQARIQPQVNAVQDKLLNTALTDPASRVDEVRTQAGNESEQAFAREKGALERRLAANGMDPTSPAGQALVTKLGLEKAKSQALNMDVAARQERNRADDVQFSRQMSALALDKGLPTDTGMTAAISGLGSAANTQQNIAAAQKANTAQSGYALSRGLSGLDQTGWFKESNPSGSGQPELLNNYSTPSGGGSYVTDTSADPGYSNLYADGGAVSEGGGGMINETTGGDSHYANGGAIPGRRPLLGHLHVNAPIGRGVRAMTSYYADGGAIPVSGRQVHGGDGQVDSIPAVIDGKRHAALNHGEFVIPTDVVQKKGVEFFEKLIQKYHTPVRGPGMANGGAIKVALPRAIEDAIYSTMPVRALDRGY